MNAKKNKKVTVNGAKVTVEFSNALEKVAGQTTFKNGKIKTRESVHMFQINGNKYQIKCLSRYNEAGRSRNLWVLGEIKIQDSESKMIAHILENKIDPNYPKPEPKPKKTPAKKQARKTKKRKSKKAAKNQAPVEMIVHVTVPYDGKIRIMTPIIEDIYDSYQFRCTKNRAQRDLRHVRKGLAANAISDEQIKIILKQSREMMKLYQSAASNATDKVIASRYEALIEKIATKIKMLEGFRKEKSKK